ncbi:MAG: hypothetical protein LUG44_08215 [Clostridiales bacterium]|nr:hypothetical protein [Clostridiales bacterium]
MKIRISDLMDHMEAVPVEMQERGQVSADRIQEGTMKKIKNAPRRRRMTRRVTKIGLVAAVLAGLLCLTAAGVAVAKWTGFALTDGMSDWEKSALLEQASVAVAGMSEDADGTTHYYDEDGNEVMTLTREEAIAYERALLEEQEQAVIDSTALVDMSTIPSGTLPHSLNELATDENGQFPAFAMDNGSMVLLYPEGKEGYTLTAGDTVTVTLEANDTCSLAFGVFRNGVFTGAETVSALQHSYTFSIQEGGVYCFSIEHFSSDANSFENGRVTIS